MNKFLISKNYLDRYTASSKAKLDCEKIAGKAGFHNIGLKPTFYQYRLIGRLKTALSNLVAYCRMPKDGVAFLQYPVFGYKWQVQLAKRKNNKVITIVHDLNMLRGLSSDFSDKTLLEQSDVLIVHTPQMKEWCRKNMLCKKVVVLGIFDYLYDKRPGEENTNTHPSGVTVAFAGNLKKSPFLDKLKAEYTTFELFGIGVEQRKLNGCCVYRGCFHPEALPAHLNSRFGLVWDGESVEACTGTNGEYLKYIAPHKISMYLSCGIPVIVWRQSAMSDFVTNNQVGIAVDSLTELELKLSRLSEEDYKSLKQNVLKVRKKMLDGYFLTQAIAMAEKGNTWES